MYIYFIVIDKKLLDLVCMYVSLCPVYLLSKFTVCVIIHTGARIQRSLYTHKHMHGFHGTPL